MALKWFCDERCFRSRFRNNSLSRNFLKMRDYSRARDMNSNDEIWITEHNAVFTLGQAAKKSTLLRLDQSPSTNLIEAVR